MSGKIVASPATTPDLINVQIRVCGKVADTSRGSDDELDVPESERTFILDQIPAATLLSTLKALAAEAKSFLFVEQLAYFAPAYPSYDLIRLPRPLEDSRTVSSLFGIEECDYLPRTDAEAAEISVVLKTFRQADQDIVYSVRRLLRKEQSLLRCLKYVNSSCIRVSLPNARDVERLNKDVDKLAEDLRFLHGLYRSLRHDAHEWLDEVERSRKGDYDSDQAVREWAVELIKESDRRELPRVIDRITQWRKDHSERMQMQEEQRKLVEDVLKDHKRMESYKAEERYSEDDTDVDWWSLKYPIEGRHYRFTSDISTSTLFHPVDDYDDGEFQVESGEIVWGQIQTLYHGSVQTDHDNNAEMYSQIQSLEGGSILQRHLRYRCAAKNGTWKVSRAYGNIGLDDSIVGPPCHHFGYVVYHSSVDPKDALYRCALILPDETTAISNHNEHVDKDVLYVNRYDHSIHCQPPGAAEGISDLLDEAGFQALEDPIDRYVNPHFQYAPMVEVTSQLRAGSHRYGGYFSVIDAKRFSERKLDIVRSIFSGLPDHDLVTIEPTSQRTDSTTGTTAFGSIVHHPQPNYELGSKHPQYSNSDELIAIVYDGTYNALEATRFDIRPAHIQGNL